MEGGLGPIYAAIEDISQDIDLLRQCSAILSYITENGENQITLIKDDVLPRLIHLSNVKSSGGSTGCCKMLCFFDCQC